MFSHSLEDPDSDNVTGQKTILWKWKVPGISLVQEGVTVLGDVAHHKESTLKNCIWLKKCLKNVSYEYCLRHSAYEI